MMRLIVAALMMAALATAAADPPDAANLAAEVQAAAELLDSQSGMLKAAEVTREFDADAALELFRRAADMHVSSARHVHRRLPHDMAIAQALVELGDVERGRALMAEVIADLAAHQPGDVGNPGSWYRSQTSLLCRAADAAYGIDEALAGEAVAAAGKCVAAIKSDSERAMVLWEYLPALALSDPAAGWDLWVAAGRRDQFVAVLVTNMVKGDPSVAAEHAEEILALPAMQNVGTREIGDAITAIIAALYRQDQRAALKRAIKMPHLTFPGRGGGLMPLAAAMLEGGVEADDMPHDMRYDGLYANVAGPMATLDADTGIALAMSLDEPMQRGMALGGVCKSLAAGDLPRARDVARQVMDEVDSGQGRHGNALYFCALPLAEFDQEVMPELLPRLTTPNSITGVFGEWWLHHRAAAEALLPQLTEAQQVYCLHGVLWKAAKVLTDDESEAIVRQAVGLLGACADEPIASRLVKSAALVGPDLAREALGKLAPLDPGGARDLDLDARAHALLATAEAFEQRERGTSGPEVAEVNRMLSGAATDARWVPAACGLLAGVYAYYDGPLAKSTADELLAWLSDTGLGANYEALTEALAALSRVDMRGTKEVLAGDDLVRRNSSMFTRSIATIARRRPEFACEMLVELGNQPSATSELTKVMSELVEDAPAESVLTFAEAWLATREPYPSDVMMVARLLLESGRAELMVDLGYYFGLVADDKLPGSLPLPVSLCKAPLEALDDLIARLQGIELRSAQSAMGRVIAARAAADWEGSQELLGGLDENARAEAILHMPANTP